MGRQVTSQRRNFLHFLNRVEHRGANNKNMKLLSLFALLGLATAEEKVDVGTVIGIDLGTTYSCVGVFKGGRVEIIANDQSNRITPSYVAFTSEGERLIGDAAKNQLTTNPKNTIFDAKRLIGRLWADKAVQSDKKFFPFELVEKKTKPQIKVDVGGKDQTFTPEEISAMVLGKMKKAAEEFLAKTSLTPLSPSPLTLTMPSVRLPRMP